MVVVEPAVSRRRRGLSGLNEQAYITAELMSPPTTFTVGDNQVYGEYTNKPLESGVYNIYVGYTPTTAKEPSQYFSVKGASGISGICYHKG